MVKRILLLASALAIAATALPQAEPSFTMTILHTNDLHAHCDPTVVKGKSVGGYARQASVIIDRRSKATNPVLLNAGDVFQGTLYFNEYVGLADLAFMNLVGYEAMCVGNHEFDRGLQPLIDFANLAKFPVLAANLDTSQLPELARAVKKSAILTVGGQKVGVIGAVPPDLFNLVLPVPGLKLTDYIRSIQGEADALTKQGIDKIILLSHAGFDHDLATAARFKNIDVIVGGHSHTLLGNVNIPDFNGSRGAYPTVAKDASGRNLPIVQAWEWGKAVGELELTFDSKGIVTSWKGAPILVDETWPENPYVKSLFAAFSMPIKALMTKPVAELKTTLARSYSPTEQPTMGFVIADSALAKTQKLGAQIAFWNAGGVRAPLQAGTVTYGMLAEVCPFGNQLVILDLTGAELLAALQHGVGTGGMLIPSKGFEYRFDNQSKKLTSTLFNNQPIDPNKRYRVTVNNFTAGGGDGHEVLKNAKGQRIDTGFVDLEALIEYFQANNPLSMSEVRIKN
jgi:5'-nucleotidase